MLDLSPAHLHLALNHIPIIGLAVATFPIVIGIITHCRITMISGLLATILCAAALPTVMQTGHEAAIQFKNGVMTPPLDEVGKNALHLHAGRAKKTTFVIYTSAFIALLALCALMKFAKTAKCFSSGLAFAVVLGNTASILLSIYTAEAGGLIRHLEFRPPIVHEASSESHPVNQ